MEEIQENLTNEKIKKKFSNNFDLANFAISLARQNIQRGEEKGLAELMKEVFEKADDRDVFGEI